MNKISADSFIRLWLLLLVLANAWVMTQSVLMLDSARDFSFALDIVQGNRWPHMGPDVGGFLHTGPVWFYMLALPLLSGSLWFTAFCVGLLAGVKFIVAYDLGRQWINRRFGLLWSACLVLPGWHTLNVFIAGHINVMATWVLLFVWLLWRFIKTTQAKWLILSGLVLSLAIHAHITAAVLLVFYLPVLWQSRTQWRWTHLLLLFVLFCVPFLPYIMAQISDGFNDWHRWQALTQAGDELKTGAVVEAESLLSALMGNLYALLIGGPQRMVGFVASVWPLAATIMLLLLSGLMATAVFNWIYAAINHRHRLLTKAKALLFVLGILLLLLTAITLLRSFTPFYMLLVFTPLLAFMWAWLLTAGGFYLRHQTGLLLLGIVLLGSIPIAALQKAAYSKQIHLGPVMNVRQTPDPNWQNNFETLDALTITDSRAWSDVLCADNVQLHGPGAFLMDLLSALPLRLSCPDRELLLGGLAQSEYQQLFLMHRSFWQAADLEPDRWLTPAWGLSKSIDVYNDYPALVPVAFDDYIHPPRSQRERQASQSINKQIRTEETSMLMVSHLLPFYSVTTVTEVTANDHKAKKVMANIGNQLYDCPACEPGPITWQIKLRTNDPTAIDMITLSKP